MTVVDLAALREPEQPGPCGVVRRRMERLRNSDAVVHTISEATRADVIELARIPAIGPHGTRVLDRSATVPAEERAPSRELGIDGPSS